MEVFARTKEYRIPCAPVRNAPEVMNDAHMHERGMLARTRDAWEHACARTPHGAPIELRPDDFRG